MPILDLFHPTFLVFKREGLVVLRQEKSFIDTVVTVI
jgi:hypothetical protein